MAEPQLKRIKISEDHQALATYTRSSVSTINWQLCIICQRRRRTKDGGDVKLSKINNDASVKDTLQSSALRLNNSTLLLCVQDSNFRNKAKYHRKCLANLLVNTERINLEDISEAKETDTQIDTAYNKVCDYIQNELIDNGHIVEMSRLLEMYREWSGKETHKGERLKKKLIASFGNNLQFEQRYNKRRSELVYWEKLNLDEALRTIGPEGDSITLFAEVPRLDNDKEIKFCGMADKENDWSHEGLRAVFYSAKETRKQILQMEQSLPWPPRPEDIRNENIEVPEILYNCLSWIISSTKEIPKNGKVKLSPDENRKILSIAQDIIYATTNGTYKTPKIVALSLAMRKLSINKSAINLLGKFGQTMSYTKVLDLEKLLELRVVDKKSKGVILPYNMKKHIFSTWVWDNLDILEDTRTGANTTHITNGIMIQWPEEGVMVEKECGPEKVQGHKQTEDYVYSNQKKVEPPEFYRSLSSLHVLHSDKNILREAAKAEFAWFISRLASSHDEQKIPSWSGFHIKTSTKAGSMSSVVGYCQPIEDTPTKVSVVYTTMKRSQEMAKQNHQKDVVLVYDQAIYSKAVLIQWDQPEMFKNVVLRMGQFHVVCNFLGVIGRRFADAGLKDIIIESELISEGSVKAVLEGKHYNRAIRVHKTCSEALKRVLWEKFDIPHCSSMNTKIEALERNLSCSTLQSLKSEVSFERMYNEFELHLMKAKELGPTCRLWLSYISMVELLKMHVRATRDGNWPLHLSTTKMMLPWMWAYDHFLYGRSLSVYLCDMHLLPSSHKEAYEFISKGCFAAKRGPGGKVACDQTIEQTINCHMKTKGPGIIGFSTNPKAVERWTHTIHEKTNFYKYCLDMVGISVEDSFQSELSSRNTKQSEAQVQAVISVIETSFSPFKESDELVSLVSGIIAPKQIQDDLLQAEDKGKKRSEEFMEEHLIKGTHSYHARVKRFNLKTFSDLSKIQKLKVLDKEIKLKADDRMFWKFLIMGEKKEISSELLLTYELGPFPWSLAGENGNLVKTKKSSLAEIVISGCNKEEGIPKSAAHIYDAMAVLHSVTKSPATMEEFGTLIFQCITSSSESSRVDFVSDTYPDLSIKRNERDYRRERNRAMRISIHSKEQKCPKQIKKYLTVENNKLELIEFLSQLWSSEDFATKLGQHVIFMNVGNKCVKIYVRNGKVCKEDVDELFTMQEEADTRMFLHASHASEEWERIVIHSPDTDVLILACSLTKDIPGLFMETNSGGRKICVRMKDVEKALGIDVCQALVGLHALTGCDTTSAFFGKGKQKAFQEMKKRVEFIETMKQIGSSAIVDKCLLDSCSEFVCSLYSPTAGIKNLNKLRSDMYRRSLHRSKSLLTGRQLPPTSDAFELHLKRTNFQALVWRNAMQPMPLIPKPTEGYGWKESGNELEIEWTTLPPAPEALLELISCSCNGACNTKRCSCSKNNVPCTECCGCGDMCTNTWVEGDGQDSSDGECN